MTEANLSHRPGHIPSAVRDKLGRCPTCKNGFSNRKYALQCCMCQQHFHSHCMNDKFERTNEMSATIKTMNGNLICTHCEQLAQTARAEAAALMDQVEKIKRQLRAQETEAERKLRREKSQGTSSNDTILREFEELKATHQATKRTLTDKYKELAQQSDAFKAMAQQTIAEKTSLADTAVAEANKLRIDVERLAATNLQLQQQQIDGDEMEIDNRRS